MKRQIPPQTSQMAPLPSSIFGLIVKDGMVSAVYGFYIFVQHSLELRKQSHYESFILAEGKHWF